MIQRKLTVILEKVLELDEIIVLTGMRRVGKTTLILDAYRKIQGTRKLYLDLENPLNQTYFHEIDYDKIQTNLENQAEGKGGKLTVFLDEIQNIRNLPSIVKYLYDHYRIKFILTGSASFYLKNLFSESLAGRKRILELFPLDLDEFLDFKEAKFHKITIEDKVSAAVFLYFEKFISDYLIWGGFPSVVLKETRGDKMTEIADIFTSYYQKEIRLLSDFRKLEAMKAAILLLLSRAGNKVDYSKLSSELGITRITLEEYLDFLEGTYFINRIKPWSKKLDVILRGQPKFYVCDNSFLTKMGNISEGALWENSVFNLLKKRGEVNFYQSKGGAEIDFIVKKDNQLTAFEVKTQAHQTDVNRLKRISQKLGIKDYFVISRKFAPYNHVVYLFQL